MTSADEQARFSRIINLLDQTGFERLQNAAVTVVGLGAVGGFATEALARAGIGRLRLVDFDTIQLSNFNRQLYALQENLGRCKVVVAKERILQINPNCLVETQETFVHHDTLEEILASPQDLVIDAIDSLNPKVELLAAVQARGIPVISSMGAALRRDPAQIHIGLLSQTRNCPLARILRKRLRRRQVSLDLPCVYSTERIDQLPSTAINAGDPQDHLAARGRVRQSLGSLPTITGIFGLTLAHTALEHLLLQQG